MRGKAHSDEVKAAVMAALLAGQGVSEVAKAYHLNTSTVKNWQRKTVKVNPVNPKKEGEETDVDEFGILLGEYLRETIRSLTVQAQQFGDKSWLQKQPASDLAILHGVQTDKAIRLLEALERGDGE